MKPRVCCILSVGSETDSIRLESSSRRSLWEKYFTLEFSSTEQIPHGFQLYVCPWFMVDELVNSTTASRSAIIAYGPEKSLASSFEAGAQDYMKEPWGIEELLVRARKLIDAPEYELSWGVVNCDGYETSVDGISLQMPPGVHRMLHLLVSNSGRILSSTLLLRLLEVENLQSRTLSIYVSEIRQKLSFVCAENPMDIVRTHYGKGYSVKP